MIGWTVSHFHIVSQLGGGRMGVVYEFDDIMLQRRAVSPVKIVFDFAENQDQLLRVGMSVQPKMWAR